jgi:hypothetical protein
VSTSLVVHIASINQTENVPAPHTDNDSSSKLEAFVKRIQILCCSALVTIAKNEMHYQRIDVKSI